MATFERLIREMPIPADWDKKPFVLPGTYGPRNFLHALVYAKTRSNFLAAGSSRAVFELNYEGRNTILKIATSIAGVAQNKEDIKIIFGTRTKNNPIVIPGIDYDEESPAPLWIHQEFAEVVHDSEFELENGFSPWSLVLYVKEIMGIGTPKVSPEIATANYPKVSGSKLAHDLLDLLRNMGLSETNEKSFLDDIGGLSNWGEYQGRYVVIDFGYSHEVAQTYYSGNRVTGAYGTGWPPTRGNRRW